MQCTKCGAELVDGNGDGRFAEIRRGRVSLSADYEDTKWDVKFSRYFCEKCFLEDPDLCAFFNKLGLRIR